MILFCSTRMCNRFYASMPILITFTVTKGHCISHIFHCLVSLYSILSYILDHLDAWQLLRNQKFLLLLCPTSKEVMWRDLKWRIMTWHDVTWRECCVCAVIYYYVFCCIYFVILCYILHYLLIIFLWCIHFKSTPSHPTHISGFNTSDYFELKFSILII